MLLVFLLISSSYADVSPVRPASIAEHPFIDYENLIFYTCYNHENLTQHILSSPGVGKRHLRLYPWNTTCSMSYLSLDEESSGSFRLETTGLNGKRYASDSMSFSVSTYPRFPSYIPEMQSSDGSFNSDPVETAFAIYALSQSGKDHEPKIEKAMAWLKENRDNSRKCWPKGGCTVLDTAQILSYLIQSRHNDTLRIIHDGQAWINSRQSFIENTPWTAVIQVSDDSDCEFEVQESITSFNVPENNSHNVSFTPTGQETVRLECDESSRFHIYDTKNNLIVSASSSGNVTYDFPGQCWGEELWKNCSVRSTIFAVSTDLPSEQRAAAMDYLETMLHEDQVVGKFFPAGDNVVLTSLYLEHADNDEEVIDWLTYKQNNDGSWKDTDGDVLATLAALKALSKAEFSSKRDVTSDGLAWMMQNMPRSGYGDIEKDTLSFIALRDMNIPYVRADPPIIILNSTRRETIAIENPTGLDLYDLRLNVSESLAGKVGFEEEHDLRAYSSINLTIDVPELQDGIFSGFLIATYNSTEIGKIPLSVINTPKLEVIFPDEVAVFGTSGVFRAKAEKSSSDFKCVIASDEPKITIDIREELEGRIMFANPKEEVLDFEGMMLCKGSFASIEIPAAFRISRYDSVPFELKEGLILMDRTKDEGLIEIKNNLDEELVASIELDEEDLIMLEDPLVRIPPSGWGKAKIISRVPETINYTFETGFTILALGYEDTGTVKADFKEGKKGFPLFIIAVIAALIVLGGGAAYIALRRKPAGKTPKKEEKKEERKEEKGAKEDKKTVKNAEAPKDMKELLRISKALGEALHLDKDALRKRLEEQGFSKEMIEEELK